MARRGREQSEDEPAPDSYTRKPKKGGEPEVVYVRTRSRNGASQRGVPLMQGLPVMGPVDDDATGKFLHEIAETLTPHRSRDRGKYLSEGRPHRSLGRRRGRERTN